MKNCLKILIIAFTCLTSMSCTQEKKIGLQLYSLRDDINTSGIEKVLDQVAEIGYSSIEIAGYADGLIYGLEPAEFKQMANDKGLEVESSHMTGFFTDDPQADIDRWAVAIKHHAEIGVEYLVLSTLPWWGKTQYSDKDVDKVVNYFNEIGKMASENGLTFCFHNHNHAFNIKVGEKNLYTILLERTNPKYVAMQMDVFWVDEAGYDPIDYLQRYAGRYPLLHIKDDNVIGDSGKLPFAEIFKAAYKQGMKTFFVEVEHYKNSPMQDVKESYEYLNNAKFVK
ncbi:MAG: sugar phosphate isomerase/epimerase [Rikenellaceae bacterium]